MKYKIPVYPQLMEELQKELFSLGYAWVSGNRTELVHRNVYGLVVYTSEKILTKVDTELEFNRVTDAFTINPQSFQTARSLNRR